MSHSSYSHALEDAHKAEMDLLAARTVNEQKEISLRAAGDVLESSRKHMNTTNEMLRKKIEEVDRLRAHKKVDDKEHAIKSPIRRVSLLLTITTHDDEERKASQQNPRIWLTSVQQNKTPNR